MKRYLVAGAVGTMVFGAALGSAAALNINDPGVVQYGQSFDLRCDTDGVTIDGYTADTESMDSGPLTSTRMQISGIDPACEGQWLVAVLADSSGNKIAKKAIQLTAADTQSVTYPAVPASQIAGVRLLIG